ncbi:MAG TPA: hypothetical protein VN222_13680 [Novosphingobium sp.]|nr:hypothetical protein [Novosphingobium sp.]
MPADIFTAMGFSAKLRGAFAKARPRIAVIGDLVALTPAELLRVPGIGPIGLGEVEIILAMHKLGLAPKVPA